VNHFRSDPLGVIQYVYIKITLSLLYQKKVPTDTYIEKKHTWLDPEKPPKKQTPEKEYQKTIIIQTRGSRHQSKKEKYTKCDLAITQDQALNWTKTNTSKTLTTPPLKITLFLYYSTTRLLLQSKSHPTSHLLKQKRYSIWTEKNLAVEHCWTQTALQAMQNNDYILVTQICTQRTNDY